MNVNKRYDDPNDPHYMTPGAREAFAHYRRNAVVGFLILLLGIGFVQWDNQKDNSDARKEIAAKSVQSDRAIVKSGRAVSVAGCNRDYVTIARLRELILAGREDIRNYVAEGTLNPEQGARAQKRITAQVKEYPLPDCREARRIVTDNPRDLGPIPPPKFGQPEEKPRYQGE